MVMQTVSRYLSGCSLMAKVAYIFFFAIVMLCLFVGIISITGTINTFLLQTLMALFVFAVPALLLAFLFHDEGSSLASYLYLNKLPSVLVALVALVSIIVMIPLVNGISGLNKMVYSLDAETEQAMLNMLVGGDVTLLLVRLLAMALIPAFTEELFFRGLIQNTLSQYVSPVVAVSCSALIFSLAHGDLSGVVPRFILGAYLGWLFWRSGSIWLSSLVHFANNALIVICYYFFYDAATQTCFIDQVFSVPVTLLSAVLVAVAVFLIHRLFSTCRK